MRYLAVIIIIVALALGSFMFLSPGKTNPLEERMGEGKQNSSPKAPVTTIVAENLDTPWAIAFLPNKSFLVTERKGNIWLMDPNGNPSPSPVATIENAKEIGEGGLLGIAISQNFESNNFVYLYYTYSGDGNNTLNRVVRMTFQNQKLVNEKILVDKIPGASNHNGGRIKFGPDGYLYIGTGDAQNPSQAQDKNSLGGKILRITEEGKAPGNPFGNLVYSFGHRNVQGLSWYTNGDLWATEHGRSGALSGLDELNLIQSGKNYGWPVIEGDKKGQGMETPKENSGNDTWAPSGAAFVGNSLFFGGLRGQSLYQAKIENGNVIEVRKHFKTEFGRIRDVVLGPDGLLYITISNQDGRGVPKTGDDKIIKVNIQKL
ncbi:MAG: PQQ-dependent sugar dehydrogenase [Candidatus Levybacteria bacterium]|nr:PQQ-dependent sugar dehydrogenase [Candidatus Levybacteria bacterium]